MCPVPDHRHCACNRGHDDSRSRGSGNSATRTELSPPSPGCWLDRRSVRTSEHHLLHRRLVVGHDVDGRFLPSWLCQWLSTGFAGQITLAPFALAGIGSLAATVVAYDWGFPFLPALVVGLRGSPIGVVVGLPAIRVRGLDLAIATLGAALAIYTAVLGYPAFIGGDQGIPISPPSLFGLSVNPGTEPKRYATVCLIALVLAAFAVGNIRRSRSGRRLVMSGPMREVLLPSESLSAVQKSAPSPYQGHWRDWQADYSRSRLKLPALPTTTFSAQ